MPTAATWLGLDWGEADVAAVEHRVLDALGDIPVSYVCTHLDNGHVAASVALDGAPAGALDADVVALARRLAETTGGAVVALGTAGAPAVELGAEEHRDGARRAALAARQGTGGRALRFPGQAGLVGELDVAEVPQRSAVSTVVSVVGGAAEGRLDTRGFVRPEFADGALRLLVRPAAGGVVIPFEIEHPHQCCGGH